MMDLEKMLHREPIADRGISVVIPAHNEAENLEAVVAGVAAVLERMGRGHEILVVNDGSTDGTRELVDRLATENKRLHAIHQATREGYGAALRSGFQAAKYPLVWQIDGDNQYDPAEIERLLRAIDHADIVCGWRENRPRQSTGVANWFFRWLLRIVFAVGVRDANCGFRLFRRSALRRIPIQSNGRFANAEILAKATFMNMLVAEIGVSCRPRCASPAGRPPETHGEVLREAAHVFRRPQFCTSTERNNPSGHSSHAA